jgi:imidazolonepropionase-like amidohydrolase
MMRAVTGVKNARITLQAGFTTVRNLNARGCGDVAVRDGINAGEIEGSRILVSGPALGITGGHADDNLLPSEFGWKEGGIADDPWMARAKVREVVKYGADVAMLNCKVTARGIYRGEKFEAANLASSVWSKCTGKWLNVFFQETPTQ